MPAQGQKSVCSGASRTLAHDGSSSDDEVVLVGLVR